MNTPGLGPTKKTLHVEEENERSALLGAIRAQSSCGRLRKVKRPQSHPCDSTSEHVRRSSNKIPRKLQYGIDTFR